MKMVENHALLAKYVTHGSDSAFRELVNRYAGLVYATALRSVWGDSHLAEDITQMVFVQLARKASSLSKKVALGGWLHQVTCNMAATAMRSHRRRQTREREAMHINASVDHTAANLDLIAPVLDEAIRQLEPEDQIAVMLRFFERYDFRSLGAALGIDEDAARMRVRRALDKLHPLLKRRGVSITAEALVLALCEDTLTAAPGGLAARVAEGALNKVAGGSALAKLASINSTFAGAAMVVFVTIAAGFYFQGPATKSARPQTGQLLSKRQNLFQERSSTQGTRAPRVRYSPEIRRATADLWRVLQEDPVDATGHASNEKVVAALKAFGPDVSAAAPILLEGVQSSNATVRATAGWGFHFMGRNAESVLSSLIGIMRSEDRSADVRISAIQALIATATEFSFRPKDTSSVTAAIPDLIPLLKSDNVRLREAAVRALGFMGESATEAIGAATEGLRYSVTPEEAAADFRHETGNHEDQNETTIDQWSARLTGSYRLATIDALLAMGVKADSVISPLKDLLTNSDRDIRVRAAVLLWKNTGRADGAEVIGQALKGMDQWVLKDTVEVLGEMGSAAESAIPNLQYLCTFANPGIRDPALAALKKIDPLVAAKTQSEIKSRGQ